MDPRRGPPYKTVGLVTILVMGLIGLVLYSEFRGDFAPRTKLTMVATRAGLVMDPGSKVTYNGVEIGRVSGISEINRDGAVPGARGGRSRSHRPAAGRVQPRNLLHDPQLQ